jgi:hypothetical protein
MKLKIKNKLGGYVYKSIYDKHLSFKAVFQIIVLSIKVIIYI